MARKTFEASVIELSQALGLLIRRVRAEAASHELSLTESSVMTRLANDGPAAIAALARAERVKPQSMGATIAGLEEAGIVERRPHPTDGRQAQIQLTAKGAEVQKQTKDAKRTWLAQAIAQLEKDEQEALFAAGEIMRRVAAL